MGHGSSPKGLPALNFGCWESLFFVFEGSYFFMEDMFSTMIDLLGKGVLAAGSLLAVWGLISVGRGLKDSNGPGIQNGVMELIGGGLIIAAAAIIGTITL